MALACVLTRYKYGHSATELPPPIESRVVSVSLPRSMEGGIEFGQRMKAYCLAERAEAEARHRDDPQRGYTRADGIDWQIVFIEDIQN